MSARHGRGRGAAAAGGVLGVATMLAGLAAFLAAPGAARADSIYGPNLLGERVDVGDARANALGGFVQTIDDSMAVLQYNPATLAWLKRFSFGAMGYFTSDVNKSEDESQRVNSTRLTHLLFAFPLYNRVMAGVGFRGRYDPDWKFTQAYTTPEGDAYNQRYERSGGLFSVPIQVAVDAGHYARIGVFYSLERGKLEDTWTIDFTGNAADAISDRDRLFHGHCFGGGFVTRPVPALSIGLTYESKIDYDVDVTEKYTSASADTSFGEKAKLPARMTLSASYRATHAMTLYAGGSICDFRKFEGIGFPADRLAEEEVGSLGIEYVLGNGSVPLRGSFTWEQLPYTMPSGENIHRIAFGVGSGRVMRGGRGKIDIALQFASTGSLGTNPYADRSVRFYFSVSGSEDWKRKRDRRE